MKNLRKLAVITLIFALVLCGCEGNTMKITQDMNGQTVNLVKEDTLILTIDGNPTTGYNWEVGEVDQTILEPLGEPEYDSDSALIGSGGTYTFTFKAAAAGTTNLKLIYYRSFEKDVPPVETFEITVVVND